jgi:Glycosyltransferase (GlcNAc)
LGAEENGAERCSGVTIFVSIAAYRDPELGPTIQDCLAKARFPEQLRFGICWQHGPEEAPLPWFSDSRFRVLDFDWRDSRGCCWARAEIMKLWQGEDWYFQLDSHHRFVPDWDVKLLEQAAATGSSKPVLSTYTAAYERGTPDTFGLSEPMFMYFNGFREDGSIKFLGSPIAIEARKNGPVRARCVSGHFIFAPGKFVEEVPYDPDLYFDGEEITVAVRAFTHGYDLFHPSELIVWHEYTRPGNRTRHWEDHNAENGFERSWDKLDSAAKVKTRAFLETPHYGRFGCGTVRSLADFESYAGVSFRHRRAQDWTRASRFPPNPPLDPDWPSRVLGRHIRIAIETSRVASMPLEDTYFWYVGVHDANGTELFRKDVEQAELQRLLAGSPSEIIIVRDFESMAEPASWTIIPHSKSHGWSERITGPVTSTVPYPRAVPGLTYVQVEDGFFVRNPGAPGQQGHLLNNAGVLLLEFANGRHSVTEIVDAVSGLYGLSASPESVIRQFFGSAAQIGLVEDFNGGDVRG